MTPPLDLDRIAVTAIAPGPQVMWARRHLPTDGLDAYRSIRTRLALEPRQPKVLLVSSPATGDGKSLTAVNLAGTLALGGGPVLLLDGDFRRPSVHSLLGIEAAPGLAGILGRTHTLQQGCRRVEGTHGLYVLPAGNAGHGAADLLQTRHWNDLTGALRAAFSYVVVDAPPVGANAEYEWLENTCDGVVLVVRPGRTGRGAARHALHAISQRRLLGIVLNDS